MISGEQDEKSAKAGARRNHLSDGCGIVGALHDCHYSVQGGGWMNSQDNYKEIKTFRFPGMVARVYIPNLTEEERARRINAIHNQAANLLKKVTA